MNDLIYERVLTKAWIQAKNVEVEIEHVSLKDLLLIKKALEN